MVSVRALAWAVFGSLSAHVALFGYFAAPNAGPNSPLVLKVNVQTQGKGAAEASPVPQAVPGKPQASVAPAKPTAQREAKRPILTNTAPRPVLARAESTVAQPVQNAVADAKKTSVRANGAPAAAVGETNNHSPAPAGGGESLIPPTAPAYLNNPKPVPPNRSIELGESGLVELNVLVDSNGHPQEVKLARSSGFWRLDEAALKAVEQWRFVPASRGGKPETSRVTVPLRFRLK